MHDALRWIGISFFPAILAVATLSALLAQAFPNTAPWFVARWNWLSGVMGAWYFWALGGLALVSSSAAFIYSARKIGYGVSQAPTKDQAPAPFVPLADEFLEKLPNALGAPRRANSNRDLVREMRAARVEKIVERFSANRTARDKSLHDGLTFAATGIWPTGTGTTLPDHFAEYGKALERFHQLARDGDLSVWGKRSQFQSSGVYEPIPAEDWGVGYVDLLDALRPEQSRVKRRDNSNTMFVDPQVSSAEFEKQWPARAHANPEADTPVAEAIVYLELGRWKGFVDDLYDREPHKRKVAYKRFERLAKLGKLIVWGMPGGSGKERPIPKSAWDTFELDEEAMEDNIARAVPRPGKSASLFFSELMVSSVQLENVRAQG